MVLVQPHLNMLKCTCVIHLSATAPPCQLVHLATSKELAIHTTELIKRPI
jgi:hypothetical protein